MCNFCIGYGGNVEEKTWRYECIQLLYISAMQGVMGKKEDV